MRLQLFFGFALVIAVVVALTWILAIRRTDAEFAVLVSEANQQEAQLFAPAVLETYLQSKDWAVVQDELRAQLAAPPPFQQSMRGEFQPRGEAVVSLDLNVEPVRGHQNRNWPGWINFFYSGQVPSQIPMMNIGNSSGQTQGLQMTWPPLDPRPGEQGGQDDMNHLIFIVDANGMAIEAGGGQITLAPGRGLAWVASNLRLRNQRLLVVDTGGTVVIDTAEGLLGESLHAEDSGRGIPLYRGDQPVGTLLLTTQEGVYNVEQTFFLNQVREGVLLSGLVSAAAAMGLAWLFAQYITRPLRALQTATQHLRAGHWGYQVDFRAKNEIGDLALAFNEMSQDLAAQRDLRTRLVKDLAHELNTPLSLMHLELQGMADGLQSPEEAAGHLKRELQEVSSLVADLVFLSQEDSSRPLKLERQNLNELLALCVQRFESSHPGLVVHPHPATPHICADEALAMRAISNLISNAIRHTPPQGQIRVRACGEGGQIGVSVQDTGVGIPPEHLAHIFERFYRVDPSRTRQSGGRGLGLAIVKQIMEQHGGRVEVNSQVGEGSHFKLLWPEPA